MNLTDDDVQDIIRLLDSSYIHELRIKTGSFELYLRRSGTGWTQETKTLRQSHRIGGVEAVADPSSEPSVPAAALATEAHGVMPIRAPTVGTYYRAPKPGAPPFVEVGSKVDEHSVVGIVETMKLMNSVNAGIAGTVIEICVADGEFVEADQTLMRVRRAKA